MSTQILISGGGNTEWGGITGTLSAQTDLQTALNAKQATLVSNTNIKTVNNQSLLGSGNISITQGRNRYQGVRNPYVGTNLQVYLGAPILENHIVNVSSLVLFNSSSGTQFLNLYASQSPSSIVGAYLIGYFSTTGFQQFSGVFTRQFHTFFVGGESEGEPYGYYAIRAISPNFSALTDIGTQISNYGEIVVGDINGITHPHLILSATQYDIQNWICEWSA